MGASAKADAVRKAKAEPVQAARRAAVFALRRAGYSYRAIGAKLGCSDVTAFRDCHHTLKELAKQAAEDAAEYRALELARLDMATEAIEAQVKSGHLGAITVWLKILEKRSRLMGLDAPVVTEVSGPDGGPIPIATVSMEVGHL